MRSLRFLAVRVSAHSTAGSPRTIRSREGAFQGEMHRGISGQSVRARAPSRGHAAESLRTIRSRQGIYQGNILRGVSGPSVRAMAHSKRTCCGESQDYPFVRGHLPMRHGAGSLRTIDSREGTFQGDMLRRVSGPSVNAKTPIEVTFCGESQEYPFARWHLP